MKPYLTLSLILCLTSVSWAAEHTKDTLETIQKATAEKQAVLVDVREKDEWKAGHIRGATFLPLSELKAANREDVLKRLPKDQVIYTHCRAGRRSVAAAELLEKWGYDVRPLKPGYDELIKFGFESEKGEP